MKITTTVIIALVLSGCASTKTAPVVRVETIEVKVPVMTPIPAPPAMARPALAIYSLTEKDKQDPGRVALLYQATVKQLQGYTLQLEAVVEGYRVMSKGKPK